MSITHSRVDIANAIGQVNPEFRGKFWVKNKK